VLSAGEPRTARSANHNAITVWTRTAAAPDAAHAELYEAALVERLAAGDLGVAVEELYDRYARRLYGLGLHLLGDAGFAEDLVQETFLRLWRSAGRYDRRRAPVRTFVFVLARRAAVDLWRRRGEPPPAIVAEPDAEHAVGTAEYEQVLTRLDMGEALQALSPAHREVLELQYHSDLTQTQVAERLGVPIGTVKSRTLYAMRALARELKDRGLVE
jgi:RNA polymerase sigma-70 factor, ECF subfamily